MKFEDIHTLMQKPEVKPDTYEAGMALNQLLKIGTHAIKIHNMIDDDAEMEAWVAKKIDLASNYVKSVHGYTAGSKVGTYDDDGMSEDASGWKLVSKAKDIAKKMAGNLTGAVRQIEKLQKDLSKNSSVKQALAQFNEDAGEGHMSKSQLYQTAKMAIELLDMIKKGDDLEGWVQTKLNLAADYLQAVYHYEDYQKLNPYREEIDSKILHRHAGIIQKHLDEILERKCRAEDVDTKPGMMRILKKRVNEVEKELAKKMREDVSKKDVDTFHKKLDKLVHKSFGHSSDEKEMKKEDIVNEDPRAVGRALANLKYAKAMANSIMKGDDMVLLRPKAQAFLSSADETIELLDKMYAGPTNEDAHLEEGMKEWAKKLAMAGVIVAGLAGIGSVNDAINNSVPAVKAMNTALEMAEKSGNDDLAKMIEKDLRDAKVRLDSGRDLPYVKDLQDKYAKFMTTEGLNFESRLAVRLEQRIK
jgi:hypothetical protein